jgi:hypothetical protein
MDDRQRCINRRRFIECFSTRGVASALMPGALAAVAQDAETITIEMLQSAQQIAGVTFTRDEQLRLLEKLNGEHGYITGFKRLRAAGLGATQPAIVFNPILPEKTVPNTRRPFRRQTIEVTMPARSLISLPIIFPCHVLPACPQSKPDRGVIRAVAGEGAEESPRRSLIVTAARP